MSRVGFSSLSRMGRERYLSSPWISHTQCFLRHIPLIRTRLSVGIYIYTWFGIYSRYLGSESYASNTFSYTRIAHTVYNRLISPRFVPGTRDRTYIYIISVNAVIGGFSFFFLFFFSYSSSSIFENAIKKVARPFFAPSHTVIKGRNVRDVQCVYSMEPNYFSSLNRFNRITTTTTTTEVKNKKRKKRFLI